MHITRSNINGILGTVIIHLCLIIVFLATKMHTLNQEMMVQVMLEPPESEVQQQEEEQKQAMQKLLGTENMQSLSEEVRKNIVVNTSRKVENEISTEKYIEQLKKDLNIQDPDELAKNYIKSDSDNETPKDKTDDQPKVEKNYKGKTTISFKLDNRSGRYIPIPVYRCEGSGDVTVNITVNREGKVIAHSIFEANTSNDECLTDMALEYARRSTFNADLKAPTHQQGSITYHFIAQ